MLVDIDGRVVELCREHFAAINAKAFKDKRLKIEIADAFEYLGRAEAQRAFRPDRRRPARSRGTRKGAVRRDLLQPRARGAAPGGFATFQTGVPFYQPWEITDALRELKGQFPHLRSLSDRGADLYRRLHGALLGGHGQAAGHAHRHR